jgi:hypothetical protein
MNPFKVLIVTALLSLGTAQLIPVKQASIAGQESERDALPLLSYLAVLGRDRDVFFTIEESWISWRPVPCCPNDKPETEMAYHLIQRSLQTEDLREGLERLRHVVPNLTYEVNKGDPRIIHIVDARLLQHGGYGLQRTIERIDFKGSVNQLPDAIGKLGIRVSTQQWMFLGSGETRDYTTVVDIRAQRLSVRDALSNYVPLEHRKGGVLWVAKTKLGEGEVTFVYYP